MENEIRARLGDRSEVGFLDSQDIRNGDDWETTLIEGLQTTRVMVCLYSPSYFNSENCSREARFFLDRLKKSTGANPALLQPVLWLGPAHLPDALPPSIARFQYAFDGFPEEYNREGLRYLLYRDSKEELYQDFLNAFADHLVNLLGRGSDIPRIEGGRSFSELPFDWPVSSEGTTESKDAEIPGDPGRVAQFVLVAGSRTQMMDVRKRLEYYGPLPGRAGRDWRPLHPHITETAAFLAQEVATRVHMQADWLRLDERLLDRLRDAREADFAVLLVVDPWTVKLSAFSSLMKQFDDSGLLTHTAVLVPFNKNDEETSQALPSLEEVVAATFPERTALGDPSRFRVWSGEPERLSDVLEEVLTQVKLRVLHAAKKKRRAGGAAPPIARAIVQGPGSREESRPQA